MKKPKSFTSIPEPFVALAYSCCRVKYQRSLLSGVVSWNDYVPKGGAKVLTSKNIKARDELRVRLRAAGLDTIEHGAYACVLPGHALIVRQILNDTKLTAAERVETVFLMPGEST